MASWSGSTNCQKVFVNIAAGNKQKRKCDKALPACGLCTRMSRACDYSDVPPAPTAEDIMTLQLKLFELESRLNSSGSERSLDGIDGRSEPISRASHTPQLLPAEPLWESGGGAGKNFPSAVFLDGGLFRRSGLYIPRPLFNVPTVSCKSSWEASLSIPGPIDEIENKAH